MDIDNGRLTEVNGNVLKTHGTSCKKGQWNRMVKLMEI